MKIIEIKLERAKKGGWFGGYHNGKPVFTKNGVDCSEYNYVYAELFEREKIYIANPFSYKKEIKTMGEKIEVIFHIEYLDGTKKVIKPDLKKGKVFITYFPYGAVNVSYNFINPISGENDCEVIEVCSSTKTLHNKIKVIKEKYHDFEEAEKILSWYENHKEKVENVVKNKKIIEKIKRAKMLEEKLRREHCKIYSEKGDECIEISPYEEGLGFKKLEEREVIETDERTLFGESSGKTFQYIRSKKAWFNVSADEISAELRNNPEVKRMAKINARYFRVKRYIKAKQEKIGGQETWSLYEKIRDAKEPKKILPPEWWSEIKFIRQ